MSADPVAPAKALVCRGRTKSYARASHGAQGHYDVAVCGRPAKFTIDLGGRDTRPEIWYDEPDGPVPLCGIHARYYGFPRPEIKPLIPTRLAQETEGWRPAELPTGALPLLLEGELTGFCGDPLCACHNSASTPAEVKWERNYQPGRVLKDRVWKSLVETPENETLGLSLRA